MGGQPRASVETALLSVAPRRAVLEVVVSPVARVVAAMAPVVTVGAGPRGAVDGGPWRAGVRWRRAVSGRCFRVWGRAAPGAAPGAPSPESSVGPWAGGWAGCEAGPRNGIAVGLPATGSPRGVAYRAECPGAAGPSGRVAARRLGLVVRKPHRQHGKTWAFLCAPAKPSCSGKTGLSVGVGRSSSRWSIKGPAVFSSRSSRWGIRSGTKGGVLSCAYGDCTAGLSIK